jgi:hypothetical protein
MKRSSTYLRFVNPCFASEQLREAAVRLRHRPDTAVETP